MGGCIWEILLRTAPRVWRHLSLPGYIVQTKHKSTYWSKSTGPVSPVHLNSGQIIVGGWNQVVQAEAEEVVSSAISTVLHEKSCDIFSIKYQGTVYCMPALMVVLAFYLKSTSATHPNHGIRYCKRCLLFCTSANNNHNPYQPTEKLWNPLQYKCGTVTEKYIRNVSRSTAQRPPWRH